MADHITRKELKKDKIHDAIEHGAEAFYLHKQLALIVVVVVIAGAVLWGSWSVYHERQSAAASTALDGAMKAYSGRIGGAPDPQDPNDVAYADEAARANDALGKFTAVANKYSGVEAGRQARYYAALCLEDLDRQNQALEELKRVRGSGDKALVDLAQYQMAVIYARTGKPDEAAKNFRELAEKKSIFVPRALALLELGNVLRQSNPKEAEKVYRQIKTEFPDTPTAEQADRGLDMLAAKS